MADLSQNLIELIKGRNLSEIKSYEFFKKFSEASLVQQAAALAIFSNKNVSISELKGALLFFMEQSVPVLHDYKVLDIVGTGGDHLGTFNISTAASLVIASSGINVAKHGGRASTSQSGSTDVIEHLGIPIEHDVSKIKSSLDRHHYAYLNGSFFNPLLKSLSCLRKSLGFQTLFNILSPMANPMRPSKIVIGVYRKDLIRKVAEVLLSLGKEHVMVVCSDEGLDEFSLSSITHVAEFIIGGNIKEYSMTPAEVGLRSFPLQEVRGGSPSENAQMIRDIFKGKITGAKLDIVLFNAASGFVVAGVASTLSEGVILAREAIQSGKAQALLNNLNTGRDL